MGQAEGSSGGLDGALGGDAANVVAGFKKTLHDPPAVVKADRYRRLRRGLSRGELPALLRGQDGRALGAARALFPHAPGGLLRGHRLRARSGVALLGFPVAAGVPATGEPFSGCRTIPGCRRPARACPMKSTRRSSTGFWPLSSGEAGLRSERIGVDASNHGGQRPAQHRAARHG